MDWQKRFEKFIQHEPMSGCWLWEGNSDKDGYGRFKLNYKQIPAHRAAYMLYVGELPDKMFVCHSCDNPSCVNPDHLFLGTAMDNAIDRENKGRGSDRKGERHPQSKLTEKDVIAIRNDDRLHHEIANDYGVVRSVVTSIKLRMTWGHVA